MPRARAASDPPERILRVYAFDPSRGARFENQLTIRIPFEKVKKGPVGRKIAVIDYDASNRCYYEGVNLEAATILGQNGLAPSESDPQFHQQMVYGVVSDTIRRFETALGREVHWRPDNTSVTGNPLHGLLTVFPHAMQEANAFYDPQRRALLFGYFNATDADAGPNLPGQIVFTCLSHDIIVHETTHAILDGIRGYFNDPTSPDAPAFHEGFADIVALLQHFSFKDSLLDTIQRTGGLIHRRQLVPTVAADESGAMIQAEIGEDNPIVDLARQFGEAMGNRKALRSALGTPPDPRVLENTFEPHERGGILVAAVFDAFFTIYINRRQANLTVYPFWMRLLSVTLSGALLLQGVVAQTQSGAGQQPTGRASRGRSALAIPPNNDPIPPNNDPIPLSNDSNPPRLKCLNSDFKRGEVSLSVRNAEADRWGDITVAQPKIWQFERMSALLDGLLQDVEGVSLGDLTQLDPSQQNGAALRFVQSALEVGVQYDQAAAVNASNALSSYNALHSSQIQQLDQYNNYMQTLTSERDRLAAQYSAASNEVNALQALAAAGTISDAQTKQLADAVSRQSTTQASLTSVNSLISGAGAAPALSPPPEAMLDPEAGPCTLVPV